MRTSMGIWWKIGLDAQRLALADIRRQCKRTDVLRPDAGRREARAIAMTVFACGVTVYRMAKRRCPRCDEPMDIHTAVRVGREVLHAQCAIIETKEPGT